MNEGHRKYFRKQENCGVLSPNKAGHDPNKAGHDFCDSTDNSNRLQPIVITEPENIAKFCSATRNDKRAEKISNSFSNLPTLQQHLKEP